MSFRMEEQPRSGERLWKATCFECGAIVANNATAARAEACRRAHRCEERL